jgi:amidase
MSGGTGLNVVEATIADLRAGLESGVVTSVELVAAYLDRIGMYDRHGITLNAVPVLSPRMFDDARASDERRAAGATLGPLDGIPYTAKDSFLAEGLTAAAGSPAFEHLIARTDAFAIERLRAAGAVLIGLTNMPPMANGGMQRGLYGRAESPYNADYLTAAFGSGSSNGSGTATAASFAAFGLGEETWSSGRAPASNNALVAYTPSRGLISVRGNWPLVPTMDVVVPHTRSMQDLLEVLDVLVVDDPVVRGDFWRVQPWVRLPSPSAVRPPRYPRLRDPAALRGKRFGVPRMYINADPEASRPIETRDSVLRLWRAAAADLQEQGAEVIEVDFPALSNYERDRPGARSMVDRGLVPEGFAERELWDLSIWAWDDFLRANGDAAIPDLAAVDGPRIFPPPPGALTDRYGPDDIDLADYVVRARSGVLPLEEIPDIADGIRGLEETRRLDFERWLDAEGLDGIVLPTVADVGPADADVNEGSARLAWRNGTWVANGNLVFRHLGIPTVTVPMGTMDDIGMPVGLTFAGRAYRDADLLAFAAAFEAIRPRRMPPPRTPARPGDVLSPSRRTEPPRAAAISRLELSADVLGAGHDEDEVVVRLSVCDPTGAIGELEGATVRIAVNGVPAPVVREGDVATARVTLPAETHRASHSHWRGPYGSVITAVVALPDGAVLGRYAVAGGVE